MTKDEKNALIQKLTDSFKDSNAILVCNYKGLRVKQLEALRNVCRDSGITVQVIKNTLASRALKQANLPEAELKDTNIYIWSNDQIVLSKVVCKFQETHQDLFGVKFGYFDGKIVDSNHTLAMSKLPTREELIGMLLSVWTGPARYFVTGLDNLRKQKEDQGA